MPRENGSGPLGKRGLTAIRGPNRTRGLGLRVEKLRVWVLGSQEGGTKCSGFRVWDGLKLVSCGV